MIAIHERENSYSARWVEYCRKRKLKYLTVNIFESDILATLLHSGVSVLLAHLSHGDYRTSLIAREILLSIENAGIRVYPDFSTFWPFDNKITQKYIFERLNIPHPPIYVFYEKNESTKWLTNADFPFVFKLKGGAGSSNVHLVKSKTEAMRLIKKMFGSGAKPVRSVLNDINTKIRIHSGKKDRWKTFKRLPSIIKYINQLNNQMERQKGYFMVQEFLPGNTFDTRIVIVGNKGFAFRRFTRPNDFRASGSKDVDLNQDLIDKRAIILAFDAAKKLGSQSMAFDILFNKEEEPVIIEMSCYCPVDTIWQLEGYWDSSLAFHKQRLRLEDTIIENLLS